MPRPRLVTLSLALLAPTIPLLACSAHEALRPPSRVADEAVEPPPHLVPTSGGGNGSTIALAYFGDRRVALVADSDARAVRVFDRGEGQELEPTYLGGEPAQLLVMDDGRVLVSIRDKAEVDVLQPTPRLGFRVVQRVPTADEPIALALTPDKHTLLVASGWGHSLDVFVARSLERRFRADVGREPRAVVADRDGARAYVAHASTSFVSVVDLEWPEHGVELVNLELQDFSSNRQLAWRHGYSLVRSDLGILAPGILANTGDTAERPSTYGGESGTPAQSFQVAMIDAPGSLAEENAAEGRKGGNAASAAIGRMTPLAPCLLPRAAAYDALGNSLFVACQGSNRLLSVSVPTSGSLDWAVGKEPTGIALDGETRTAFVWSQLSRTISYVPMDATRDAYVKTAELGDPVDALDLVRLGRELFSRTSDPRIASDGRGCTSCHPDGRDDGLVWSTPDGPRQTPTLAGRLAGTAPYGWNGARETVFKHVTGTLKRLGGTGLDHDSMAAVVAYCMAMKTPPRRESLDANLVAEGRDLFAASSTGCSSCHIQDGTFTDGNRHDVKSKAAGDPHRSFDTPSLRFVSGTAPYFHDGRFSTLRALLLSSGGDGPSEVQMGHSAQLSEHEIDALEAYLRTL